MNFDSFISFSRTTGSQLRNMIVGIWLVAFCYLGTFYIVLCALSAYQVLDRAKEYSNNDIEITVTQLIQQAENIANLQIRKAVLESEIASLEVQFAAENRASRYWDILDPIVESVGIDTKEIEDPLHYRAVAAQVIATLSETGAPDTKIDEFKVALEAFEAWKIELNTSEQGNKLKTLENSYNAQNRALDAVNQQLSAFDEKEPQLAIAREIRSLRPWFHILATQPESVLVFVLVIAMGALGSTIHITQYFLSGESGRPLTWYFIRPLLGTVTAVAIYILAKAGQLVLDPSKASATMSPWFISFMAIISGLLSGAAIESISRAGRRFFESAEDVGTPRWGVKLNDKLSTASVNMQQLSAALGVPEPKLDAWADATEPVPQNEQEIIAAWLRLPLREVFSDVDPVV